MFDRHALQDALAAIGREARLRVTVPHSLAIPALLRDDDMLAIVPTSLAKELTRGADLLLRQPPYPAAPPSPAPSGTDAMTTTLPTCGCANAWRRPSDCLDA